MIPDQHRVDSYTVDHTTGKKCMIHTGYQPLPLDNRQPFVLQPRNRQIPEIVLPIQGPRSVYWGGPWWVTQVGVGWSSQQWVRIARIRKTRVFSLRWVLWSPAVQSRFAQDTTASRDVSSFGHWTALYMAANAVPRLADAKPYLPAVIIWSSLRSSLIYYNAIPVPGESITSDGQRSCKHRLVLCIRQCSTAQLFRVCRGNF